MAAARVILHLPEKGRDLSQVQAWLALYPRVAEVLRDRGIDMAIAGRSPAMMQGGTLPGDGDLHLVENGWVSGPGWLNAGLAYLPGFWHLDPLGILGHSSIGARAYDPASVDLAAARGFLDHLRDRFVVPRRSRYAQPRAAVAVPAGAIAVFLQGPQPYRRGQAHLSAEAMLRAVIDGAGGRPVVVKPHPQTEDYCLAAVAALGGQGAHLQVLRANVHDILARAAVTVSVNSAVAIEGFLHGKPAILFGRSDFARFATTVTDARDFPGALQAALMAEADYARPLRWYFGQCLEPDAPDFADRLVAVFAAQGFDGRRPGLRSGPLDACLPPPKPL